MAITRTQIAKQLLAQGGRIGFKGGADASTQSFSDSAGLGQGTARDDPSDGFNLSGGQGPTFDGAPASQLNKDQIKREKEYRNFIQAYNKKLPFVGPAASFLRNVIPGNKKLRSQFINQKLQNQKIKDFYENLSDKEKDNFDVMQGLTEVGYDQYAADMGSPALLYSGNVGGLEKYVTGKDEFGNTTYGYKGKTDGNDAYIFPRSGIMVEAPSDMDQEPEIDEDEGLSRRFRANGGRIGFRGGDAAKSDAASGRDAGRADPGGGVDDRSDAGQTAVNNAAIMMARMQNQNLNEIKNPNLIEKFPGGVRAIDKINLDRMLANKNLNTITTDDDEDANAINTVFSPDIATNLQTVFGTGLGNRQQIEKNILDSMADGGRAGLAEGGMPYEGGIMDLESARQMYGLGKLVKKVTRSVKKIAKSPIGKAAIIGAGIYGLGGGFGLKPGGFSFGNLPGASFFAKSTPVKLASGVADRLAFNAARTAAGASSKGLGIGTLIGGASLLAGALTAEQEEEAQLIADNTGIDIEEIRANPNKYLARRFVAEGGSMDEPVAKKTMPLLDMGGKEMDLRAEGGFVPIGRMEKADDVPARLSKNEFVFTAEAVRNAGEGDVDKGAEVMYNMMKNLESGGDVSEESQGLNGARKRFQTSQRLEEVL